MNIDYIKKRKTTDQTSHPKCLSRLFNFKNINALLFTVRNATILPVRSGQISSEGNHFTHSHLTCRLGGGT